MTTNPSQLNVLYDGALASAPTTVRIRVDVNRNHCHLYAVCEQEAPEVFRLSADGRLEYSGTPDERHLEAVRQAARVCPMQAIEVEEQLRGS